VVVVGELTWPIIDLRSTGPTKTRSVSCKKLWDAYRPQLQDYIDRALDPTNPRLRRRRRRPMNSVALLKRWWLRHHQPRIQPAADRVRPRLPRGFDVPCELIYNDERSKANLFATLGPADRPGIVLSGHTDVVPVDGQPWTVAPFELTERDGKLYGRGTADMKGYIACVLALVPALVAATCACRCTSRCPTTKKSAASACARCSSWNSARSNRCCASSANPPS
jgi:acetylornithine deacetylase